MSGLGTAASNYNSPIDFRVSQLAPYIRTVEDANAAISQIYDFMQQAIHAFGDFCGIGQQVPSQWAALAANPARTLLAGNLNRFYVKATEAIANGAIINLHAGAGGTIEARNANATNNTKIADGFCSTASGIAAGDIGEVILGTGVASIGGVTVGQRYWLSTVNGLISNIPAVAAGNVEQLLGIGIDTTHFFFNSSSMWLQH